jgi:DNA-binding HxlR family transcriptional regulator
MAVLSGALADRNAWSAVGECPIERTIALVGTRSALLILREAYYGTTRFDDFCRRVGITKAAAAARLDDLVDAGLLTRRPYQDPGQRTRDEYVLTAAGTDFMPVVWALFQWGQQHLPNPVALRLAHEHCDEDVAVEMRCNAGHLVRPDELALRHARRSKPT